MVEKVYYLGEKIFDGGGSCIYSIKGKSRLIAKVNNSVAESPDWASQESSKEFFKKSFKKELSLGQLIYRNGISTPRYVGIVNVIGKLWNKIEKKYSNENLETIGLIIEIIPNSILIKEDIEISDKNYLRGLLLLKKEKEKLKKLPIEITPLSDFQGLYSSEKDKIYLIDFEAYHVGNEKLSFIKKLKNIFFN